MALPVANDLDGSMARLLRLLAPQPGRLEFAARLALICALTVLVVEIYQTPSAALTAYMAFFLNKPDRVTSIILSAAMVLVMTLLIGLLFLLANVVLEQPAWRVAAMATISFVCLFLVSASKLRPVGQTFAIVIAFALDLLGSVPVGELATRGLLYAWLYIGIPAGISIIVSLLLAPSPRQLLQRDLAGRMRLAADLLRSPDREARGALSHCLHGEVVEIASLLRLAGAEKTSLPSDLAALGEAAHASIAVLLAVEFVLVTPGAALPDHTRASLARTLDEMAAILKDGGYPLNVTLDSSLAEDLSPLAAGAFGEIRDALARFAVTPAAALAKPPKQKTGFLLPDAFTNTMHIHYALKTTAAAMFCYLLYSILDWPGIHTCLITCYIVSLGTVAESVEKLTLRIVGCLIGAALGLGTMIFLVPFFTSITGLLATVFIGALAAAWVAAGSPRIAYVGFQIAFAFFLCVVQGASPAFDMVVARDRVIGIILGNLVSYLVFVYAWPISIKPRIETAISGMMHRLAAMSTSPDRAARRVLAEEVGSALGVLQDDLNLVHYEPASIRPTAEWVEQRREVARRISILEAPLLMIAEQDAAAGAQFARRLSDPSAPLQPDGTAFASPLRMIVDRRIRDLEAAIAAGAGAANATG